MKKVYWILHCLLFSRWCWRPASQPILRKPPAPAGKIPPDAQATDEAGSAPGAADTLTVMTHDSFSASEEVIRQFEQENNVTISFLLSGDAGSTLNRAVLTSANPLADVLYGVDNTFLSRALEADIFEPYASPLLDVVPDAFKLDAKTGLCRSITVTCASITIRPTLKKIIWLCPRVCKT
jgi:ABC-type thiamine transport system substrate-binding protein